MLREESLLQRDSGFGAIEEAAGLLGGEQETPSPELEALVAAAPRWRQWIGPALSIAIVAAVLVRMGGIDVARMLAMLPADPLFWLCFAAAYAAQPISEWLIFRRLWRLPASGVAPLFRKQVGNEILLGYIGEVYFYGWARRHSEIVASPFGAIKDVTILSAMMGNLVTIAALVIGWPVLSQLPMGLHARPLVASVGVVIATSLAAMLFRHKLFSLKRGELIGVSAMHLARIVGITFCTAAMWHLLLPQVALAVWLLLATLRLLVSRLPLIPNKELVFAGLALLLAGHDTRVAEATALIAGLFLVAHIMVGLALGLAEAWRLRSARA
ncbi:MAG TPA: hypothetical protein VFL92_13870 [Sphingomonas sp.]|nr:hypothetical protein [Sphingomonas sp.]